MYGTVRADTAGAITDPQPYGIVHTMYTVRMHSIHKWTLWTCRLTFLPDMSACVDQLQWWG